MANRCDHPSAHHASEQAVLQVDTKLAKPKGEVEPAPPPRQFHKEPKVFVGGVPPTLTDPGVQLLRLLAIHQNLPLEWTGLVTSRRD